MDRSTEFSYGMQCCDGFLAVGKIAYSYEIDYEHDAMTLTIHRIQIELPGPH